MTALVVDDELLIRWSVAEVLSEAGWIVREATDGRSALAALDAAGTRVDAVLLDYRLPDAEGLTLLAEIRKRAPRAAVVLMTAFATPDVISGAVALGAHYVLAKPFDVNALSEILQRAAKA